MHSWVEPPALLCALVQLHTYMFKILYLEPGQF